MYKSVTALSAHATSAAVGVVHAPQPYSTGDATCHPTATSTAALHQPQHAGQQPQQYPSLLGAGSSALGDVPLLRCFLHHDLADCGALRVLGLCALVGSSTCNRAATKAAIASGAVGHSVGQASSMLLAPCCEATCLLARLLAAP